MCVPVMTGDEIFGDGRFLQSYELNTTRDPLGQLILFAHRDTRQRGEPVRIVLFVHRCRWRKRR